MASIPLASPAKHCTNLPLKRSPVILNLPLGFSGAEGQIADRTVELFHDRSRALELKEFYSGNSDIATRALKESSTSDGQRSVDLDWVSPPNLQAIQDALINFMILSQQLWPTDPTPACFWKTLVYFNWASELHNAKVQKEIIFEYFLQVGKDNANRAVRKEGPLTQAAHEVTFRKVCSSFKINADNLLYTNPANFVAKSQGPPKKASSAKTSGGGGKAKPQASAKASSASKERWPTYQGLGVCFSFNSTKADVKCNNTPTEKGCEGKNKKGEKTIFAHVCAEWLGDRKGHCLGPHPRKEHPA